MDKIPVRKIRAIQNDSDFSEIFSIRDIQTLLSGKDMIQEIHRHDFFLVIILNKGKGSHEIDFTPYQVKDGSVFFLRPGQVHRLTLKVGSTGFIMQFKKDFYYPHDRLSTEQLRTPSNKALCQLNSDRIKRLLAILTHIYQEYTDKEERYQEIIKANLGIFFIELIRNRQNINRSATQANSYSQQRLDEFLELLESDISVHKEVSYYAEQLNISPFQLNAITKATLNKTCSELIILESKSHESKKFE